MDSPYNNKTKDFTQRHSVTSSHVKRPGSAIVKNKSLSVKDLFDNDSPIKKDWTYTNK